MEDTEFLFLREGCFVVKGACGGAIYDAISKNVYAIDLGLAKILEKANGKKIKSIISAGAKFGIKKSELKQEMKSLYDLGLIYYSSKFVYIDKMKSNYSKELREKEQSSTNQLLSLTCEIQGECNLKCLHCERGAIPICNDSCRKFHTDHPLSVKEWEEIIEIGALFKCNKLRFIGGEPFLVKGNFLKLLSYSKNMNYEQIEIYTNGTLLNSSIINILKEPEVTVIIPIYSFNPQIHDKITQISGSFKTAINNVFELKSKNIEVIIYLLVLKQNQDTINETLAFFNKENIKCKIDIMKPLVRKRDSLLIPEKWIHLLYRDKTKFYCVDLHSFYRKRDFNPCWFLNIAVKNNGDIVPCLRARDIVIENVRIRSLISLLKDGAFNKYWDLSIDEVEICRDCEFRYACDNCRVTAQTLSGNLNAKDYYCRIDPYTQIM